MKLLNLTQKKILSDKLEIAGNILQKTRGLILIKEKKAIFFKTRWGIHSFGVLYPLTILVCDKEMEVVKTKNMKHNSFFFWNPKYENIVELPEKNVKVKLKDKLKIEE